MPSTARLKRVRSGDLLLNGGMKVKYLRKARQLEFGQAMRQEIAKVTAESYVRFRRRC